MRDGVACLVRLRRADFESARRAVIFRAEGAVLLGEIAGFRFDSVRIALIFPQGPSGNYRKDSGIITYRVAYQSARALTYQSARALRTKVPVDKS